MAVVSHNEGLGDGPVLGLLGWLVALVLLGIVFAVWAIYSHPALRAMVPAPGDVLSAFAGFFGDPSIWRATGATLVTWLPAFAIAGIFGIVLGLAAGRGLGAVAAPSLFVFAAFPIPAMVMMLVIWYGFDRPEPRIAAGALLAFFPIVAVAAYGLRAPDRASRSKAVFRALEIGAILALTGVVLAESIAGKDELGYLLVAKSAQFDTRGLFALVLWIWGLGLVLASPFAIGRWLAGMAR